MSTLVKPSEEDPKNEIEINKSDLHVDSVADAVSKRNQTIKIYLTKTLI